MNIVYNKTTGTIEGALDTKIDYKTYYQHFPREFQDDLDIIPNINPPTPLSHYRVINKKIIKMADEEIQEIHRHGRILTEEERIQYKKSELINVSKSMLSQHLQDNPLQYTDGKYYSVTADKQNLLNNAISVYQIKVQAGIQTPTLEWNATGEECTEWTIEELSALALAISEYVTPLVKRQQAIEVEIKSCTTVEELDKIVIDYETV